MDHHGDRAYIDQLTAELTQRAARDALLAALLASIPANPQHRYGGAPMTDALLNLAGLKERGWTPAMVRRLLGEPDAEKPNPYYRSAAPMRLYAHARVVEAEAREEWKKAREQAERRSEAMKLRAAKLSAEAAEKACALPIEIPRFGNAALTRKACAHYNAHSEARAHAYRRYEGPTGGATPDSDPPFLMRITVNFLRHECSDYEAYLDQQYGVIGGSVAKEVIRERIYEEISRLHPRLADECRRQLEARH